jgi:formate dehydrogenase subunit gamma
MFLPWTGPSGGYSTGIIHRIAAVAFIASPLVYAYYEPGSIVRFCREIFIWTKDDLKWLRAAPAYYFGGPEESMPPQDRINTGQKFWQLGIFGTSFVFLITGTTMWFFKPIIGVTVYQWILFAHGITFIIVIVMFLVHVYMGVFHPRMGESLRSMLDGKVSPSYARSHYRKWYDRATGDQ